jgi:flagellar motor switch protein FliG
MNRESSIRKAAVLVASLDADTADLLLAQIPPQQADAVRAKVLQLDELDPREQQAIIDEFFLRGPLQQQNSSDLARGDLQSHSQLLPRAIDEYLPENPLVENLSDPHALQSNHKRKPHGSERPFDFLQNAELESLVPMLEKEHPQAIALVLAHLPHERAGHVLARLPATMQTDVIRRLVDLEETDPQILRDVEQAVEAWLQRGQPTRRRVAGVAAVSAILSASEGIARRQILNNLTVHDRPLAHKLTPTPIPQRQRFTFVEVCSFPVTAFMRVVRSSDHRTVILALGGAPANVVEPLLAEIGTEESDWISKGLQNLGPLRLVDFDRAQNKIADLASQLYAQGQLSDLEPCHLTAMA